MPQYTLLHNVTRPEEIVVAPANMTSFLVHGNVRRVGEIEPSFEIQYIAPRNSDTRVKPVGSIAGARDQRRKEILFTLRKIASESGLDARVADDVQLISGLLRYDTSYSDSALRLETQADLYLIVTSRPPNTRVSDIFCRSIAYAIAPEDGPPRLDETYEHVLPGKGAYGKEIDPDTWLARERGYPLRLARAGSLRVAKRLLVERDSVGDSRIWLRRPNRKEIHRILHDTRGWRSTCQ